MPAGQVLDAAPKAWMPGSKDGLSTEAQPHERESRPQGWEPQPHDLGIAAPQSPSKTLIRQVILPDRLLKDKRDRKRRGGPSGQPLLHEQAQRVFDGDDRARNHAWRL